VPAASSETAYIFNNVLYDNLENASIERGGGVLPGKMIVSSNTMDCGTEWSGLDQQCSNPVFSQDTYEDNHFITTATAVPGCGTCLTNLTQTPTVADENMSPNFDQYAPTQSYAYSPVASTNSTVGTVSNLTALCNTIAAAQAAAGAACQVGTSYGLAYNPISHTITGVGLVSSSRPTSGDWNIGAYVNPLSSEPVATITWYGCGSGCTAYNYGSQIVDTTSATFIFIVTNTGSANLVMSSEALTVGSQFAIVSNTCGTNTITPAGSCAVGVTFTPTSTGTKSDTLTFTDNASPTTQTVSLTGTGTAAPPSPTFSEQPPNVTATLP
jgi:hypothetical protein